MKKNGKVADIFVDSSGRSMRSGRAPLSRFKPWPENPRTHPPAELEMLARLMKQYGTDQPIVVDEDWWILKGHGRRESAFMADLEDFPYVQRLDLSDAEKLAMRIEDNQVSLLAGWNAELISGHVGQLKQMGYDINLLGFGKEELVQFTTTPGPESSQNSGLGSLAERFGVVPFSVLNAREGWWQDRKRAWLSLGIQSELGRGQNSGTNAEPGGSKMPSASYSQDNARGDGRGRPVRHKPNAIPGGAMLPLERAKNAAKS